MSDVIPDRYVRILSDYMQLHYGYARSIQPAGNGSHLDALADTVRYMLTRGFSLPEVSQACGLSVLHLQNLLK